VWWCEIEEEKIGRVKENGGIIAVSLFFLGKQREEKESSRVDLPCSHSEWLEERERERGFRCCVMWQCGVQCASLSLLCPWIWENLNNDNF